MKEFWQVLVKYVKPYRGYLGGSIVLNMLSAVLNIFSFSLIIPILQILFKMSNTVYSFIPWDSADMGFKDIVINNAYYGVTVLIQDTFPSLFVAQYHNSHEDSMLLRFIRHHDSYQDQRGERYETRVVQQDSYPSSGFLLAGTKGRHHSQDEW